MEHEHEHHHEHEHRRAGQSSAPSLGHTVTRSPMRPSSPLAVGASDDPLEREADRTADAVLRALSLDPAFQPGGPTRIRRTPGSGAAVVGPQGGTVDGDLAGRIRRTAGGGRPLDGGVRTRMEGAFGHDLGQVRVHRGPESADLNAQLGARAFTLGSDIHLGSGVPSFDSAAGTHLLAHELAHVVQQSPGRVRRLVDRAGLVALAGAPKGNIGPLIRKSVEYKAILDLLDRYHAERQRVWTSNQPPDVVTSTLTPILDQIATACWSYVQEQGEGARTPHIRTVANEEVPAEKRRLKALTTKAGFAGLDRTQPMGHTTKPAKVVGVGVDVGTTQVPDPQEGGTADCHSMQIWVDIDAGAQPSAPPGAPANSIHGVTIEYWENVSIPYHFRTNDPAQVVPLKTAKTGKTLKPWNDIFAMAPDSPTFTKTGGRITMSWPAAVTAAAGGGFVGRHTVGFQDNPGVTPLAGKHIKRILRFRIVVKDATSQHQVLATQVITTDGTPVPVSMTYVDSLGTKVGRERNVANTALAPMDAAAPGLAAHDVTAGKLAAGVPAAARAQVRPFVRQLLGATAAPFVNKELDNVRAKFATATDLSGPYKAYSRMGKKKNDVDDYYEIAGMNSLPYPQPGMTFSEFPVGAGLLVAITEGRTIRRMYYTRNTSRKVGAQQVRVRSFRELPIEGVLAYVPAETAYLAMSPADRLAYDQVAADETAGKAAAVVATNALTAAVAGGAPQTLQYLQHNIGSYDAIAAEYDAAHAPSTLAGILRTAFDASIARAGAIFPIYRTLSRRYPDPRAWAILDDAFVAEYQASGAVANLADAQLRLTTMKTAQRGNLGAAPDLRALARLNAGNPAAMATAIMTWLRTHPAPKAEEDYNTVVAPLNIAGAPATLGELVHGHFLAELRAGGKGIATFARLSKEFPQFVYRLRPAYRFLFGDAELQLVTVRLKAGKAAGDVDAGSTANMTAKQAFRTHGPFTQADFTTALNDNAKFDVAYDPATSELRAVVKLSFEFLDAVGINPTTMTNKEVGKQYGTSAWTDASRAAWKAELRRSILDQWNSNAPTIRCTRPGWEDIVATPVFDIQEVAKGAGQHNNIRATKAVFEERNNQKQLYAPGTSGWAGVQTGLREYDVADKIADPSVHRYLHLTERTGNIAPAYTSDNKRLIARLAEFGTIPFAAGRSTRTADRSRLPLLVEELGRLGVPDDLAHLHAMEVVGNAAGGDAALAGKRATWVIKRLKALGIKNTLTHVVGNAGTDTVTVRAAAPDPQIVDTYERKWTRISAAHEFGHMIGLMDEYYGAKSEEVVKKMISDGLLPPNTPANHLVANPPAANMGEAEGQTTTMKLLEANDLDTPDFTLDDGARSASLMTGGYELWPQHYISVWEALTTLTAGEIDAKYWKLG